MCQQCCAVSSYLYRRIGVIVLLVYVSDCRVPAIEYEWFGGCSVPTVKWADGQHNPIPLHVVLKPVLIFM